eukprot:scaffold1109_cov90-Amphora_coffeaeformis.AAC.1
MEERAVDSQEWAWAASSCGQNQSRPVRWGCWRRKEEVMGSALGWDNMAAMMEGPGQEETEAVGKRRRRVGAATELGSASRREVERRRGWEVQRAAGSVPKRQFRDSQATERIWERDEEREGGDDGRNGGDGRGGRRGMVGRAAGGVLREEGRVEGSRAGCEGRGQGSREGVQVAAPVEGVNVGHHGGGPVDYGPIVHEEFLGPATELVA